jgi:hypothetical protein
VESKAVGSAPYASVTMVGVKILNTEGLKSAAIQNSTQTIIFPILEMVPLAPRAVDSGENVNPR